MLCIALISFVFKFQEMISEPLFRDSSALLINWGIFFVLQKGRQRSFYEASSCIYFFRLFLHEQLPTLLCDLQHGEYLWFCQWYYLYGNFLNFCDETCIHIHFDPSKRLRISDKWNCGRKSKFDFEKVFIPGTIT